MDDRPALKLFYYNTIDSTQTQARRSLASLSKEEVSVFIAEEQTAGLGTRGKKWISPSGGNLYMTLVAFAPIGHHSFGTITLLAAKELCKLLNGYGYPIQLKWPNDLMLAESKVGGVLAEVIPYERLSAVILGIGLNIYSTSEQLENVGQKASSLNLYASPPFERDALIYALIDKITSILLI